MKKSIIAVLISLAVSVLTAESLPSDILKDEANFSKAELFDNEKVFFNIEQNKEVVKNYEANPAKYKDEELLPIAICYMSLQNPEKSQELFAKFLKARPDNLRAIKVSGTISLLTGKSNDALVLFKKAYSMGDKESAKMIASVYFFTNEIAKIEEVLPTLKELSKTDLAALNMILFYAMNCPQKRDPNLAKDVVSKIDVEKTLEITSSETLAQALNIYSQDKSIWTGEARLIPAMGAVKGGYWSVARQLYDDILAENPNNTKALIGKSVVEFRLGGLPDSQKLLEKVIALGEKNAVNEAMDLFLASKVRSVYDTFKPHFKDFDFRVSVRYEILDYALKNEDAADICMLAFNDGKNFNEAYSDARAREYAMKAIEKFAKEPRFQSVKSRLKEFK